MQKYYLYFILVILLSACAQQVVPTGGKKDETAPKILSYKPDNKSINFNSDKITIKFDEYISIKDPGQIIISPFLKDKPLIESNGKQISISFLKSKPIPNTTYTLNFSNSIVDVNEGNSLNNFSYVFSTGNYLDSNFITGTISNALTTKDEKEILVALYNKANFTDTTVYKTYPSYFTKSKENGRFIIANLPLDTFILLAFKDENSDNKYQKTEEIAFSLSPILPNTTVDSIDLQLFKNPMFEVDQLLDTISKQKHLYQFIVYKPSHIKIEPIDKIKIYSNSISTKSHIDTLQIFIPNSIDSIGQSFKISTIDSSYYLTIKTKNRSKLPIHNIHIWVPEKPTDSIKIKSNIPIDTLTVYQITFMEDTVQITPTSFRQVSNFEWVLFHKYKENTGYTIELKDSICKDVFGRFNKKVSNSFSTKSEKDFGTMVLSITQNTKKNTILQLVEIQGSEEILTAEWKYPFQKDITIKYLRPGNYQFKIIDDRNKNGVWDSGNYSKSIQPETIYYDKTTISIKAYWDIEQSIDIDNIINK